MSFDIEASKKALEINVVVQIDGVNYAVKQPDSGLVIDADKLVIDRPQVNGVTVDVRRVSTPIGTFSFQVKENSENPTISSIIMQNETQWLKKECIVSIGFLTGSFDFADYKQIARTRVTNVTKIRNGYSIRTAEATSLVDEPALNTNDILQTFLLSTSTSLDVVDGSQYPDDGIINVGEEFMFYASKDGNTLQGLTRGLLNSEAVTHNVGEQVFLVTEIINKNPITLMLEILLSITGDGTNHPVYDVLDGGLGLSPDDIDITKFEQERDDNFLGEEHSYYIYNNESMLKFFERTTLISTNARLVTIDGKISLAILDQIDFESDIPILDESTIVGTPTWSLDETKIKNRIEISYDFNVATGKYESLYVDEDADSIALYGTKTPLKLNFEGVKTAQNGAAIVVDRSSRLLSRLSTPRGNITVTSHFDAINLVIGGNVQLVHRFLPQQGGTLGFSDRLEVMSRSIDIDKAIVKTKLDFTSYTGIRIPFIAPSPRVVNYIDDKNIEVDNAECLQVGFLIKLFRDGPIIEGNKTAGAYLPDVVNEIESITGNIVTFKNSFTSTFSIETVLKMADYDNASEEQKARYGYIGSNTGFFNDGSKSYQVVF